jgi:hypothetical protein
MKVYSHKLPIYLLLIATVLSCQPDDAFDIPTALGTEENTQLNALQTAVEKGEKTMISIRQLKAFFVYSRVHTITADLVVKGYVVSSDSTGNFYKEIYLQDKPENPTAAIHVMLDQADLYNRFNVGREIYIDLKGLHIGESRSGNGIISLGGALNEDGDEVSHLRALDIPDHFLRSNSTEEVMPSPVLFSEINSSHIGMYVEIANVRFAAAEQGKPFVDPKDYYDTQRNMEACEGQNKVPFLLETSAFASFKDLPLPDGTGSIKGIVSKTYNGRSLVLVLNDAHDAWRIGGDCVD